MKDTELLADRDRGPVNITRDRFAAALEQLDAAGRHARHAAEQLPSIWEQPTCCDTQTLLVVEPGYRRWSDVDEFEPSERTIHADTDGWDDMSEQGLCEYLACRDCGATWKMPDELTWD